MRRPMFEHGPPPAPLVAAYRILSLPPSCGRVLGSAAAGQSSSVTGEVGDGTDCLDCAGEAHLFWGPLGVFYLIRPTRSLTDPARASCSEPTRSLERV